ncbi:hypothetical protein FACS189441_5410 [Betaproteobacteria bacterium]|nr:hypothetical protein FACS189441_5410 [Betaproteobacteria bacterium]
MDRAFGGLYNHVNPLDACKEVASKFPAFTVDSVSGSAPDYICHYKQDLGDMFIIPRTSPIEWNYFCPNGGVLSVDNVCIKVDEPMSNCKKGDITSGSVFRGMAHDINFVGDNTSLPYSACDGSCVFDIESITSCSSPNSPMNEAGTDYIYPPGGIPVYCFYTGPKTGDACSFSNDDVPPSAPGPDNPNDSNNPSNPNDSNNPSNSSDSNNPNNSNNSNNSSSGGSTGGDGGSTGGSGGTTPSDGKDDEGESRTAGGGCQNFTCNGDAIDCSIAKAAWENRCVNEWAEKPNDFSDAWNTAKGQEGGDTNIVKEEDAEDWFTLNNYISTPSSCPADISFSVFGKTITAPLAWLCAYLSIIALILKTLAWLFVGHKILGAF